jgi:cytochrome c-type biogenesis protein CcmH/NrfG
MRKPVQYALISLIALSLGLSACAKSKTVEEYLKDGQNYLEDDDVSKAIASLEEVLKREPGQAEAHRLLGEALSREGRWPEAVAQFESYVNLDRDDAAALFSLGQAYVQTGDAVKAAQAFAEGARVDPSFLASHGEEIAAAADDILQAGRQALEAGDLATATQLLSIVAPLVPGEGDVYALLGEAHLQTNDVTKALGAFATAL